MPKPISVARGNIIAIPAYLPTLLFGLFATANSLLRATLPTEMPTRILLFILFAATLTFAADAPKLRLPNNVKPLHHDLDLTLLPGTPSFTGKIDIDIEFLQPSTTLWLNALDLEIPVAEWKQAGKTTKLTVDVSAKNFVGFTFPAPVSGKGRLHAEFKGKVLTNSTAGIFELKDNGTPYLFSQFEATDARRAFPCFDEPSYKVTWQLTLHGKKTDRLFSNTPQLSQKDEPNDMQAIRFARTKPLPSYLVAFAAGPFETVDAGKIGKTALRIIVPKGRTSEAKYAAETVGPLLKILQDYFGMPYPFEKLDSIALPVSQLAMENPGLITYPQSILLSSPEKDTINRQRSFADVAAHEMAHQWFGDLVTTAWWDDIWLNEAFASWMEAKVLKVWKPEWHWETQAERDKLSGMREDSLVSARKIRQPIESDDDISNAFDSITYLKGEAVINTFEKLVGADKFRQGVRSYMKRYANQNTTTPQFLASISEAAGRDIAPAFNTFLDRPGIPKISMGLDCKGAQPKLHVSQKRYLPLGAPGAPDAPASWQVPLCIRYEVGGKPVTQCELLTDPKSDITLKSAQGCPAWVVGNAEGDGYYRVSYQGDLFSNLIKTGGTPLSVKEKIDEIANAAAMVDSGDLPPGRALELVGLFSKDPDGKVVMQAAELAGFAEAGYLSADAQAKGRFFLRKAFGERAVALGWKARPGDDDETKLLRQSLVPMVANAGEEKLIAEAKELAQSWLADHKSVDQNQVGGILAAAARFGDAKYFEQLLAALRAEKDSRTRVPILIALGAFRDRALIERAEALAASGEFDVREGAFALFVAGSGDPATRDMPLEFVKKNIEQLEAKLPRGVGGDAAASLPFVGSSFCDEDHKQQLKTFFEPRIKNYSGGPRNLAQALESIDICIGKKKALEPGVVDFLSRQ